MSARYDLIRGYAADVSEAEREAYAELAKLARKWRERNTYERVLNSLQALREKPFI